MGSRIRQGLLVGGLCVAAGGLVAAEGMVTVDNTAFSGIRIVMPDGSGHEVPAGSTGRFKADNHPEHVKVIRMDNGEGCHTKVRAGSRLRVFGTASSGLDCSAEPHLGD